MTTRLAFVLAALLALPAAAAAQEREWEEDYTDSWDDDGREPVDVQVEADSVPTATLDQSFEAGLSPYGSWVTVSSYGRVWRPHVATGWRPYYYGRWEWTNEGWLWVSDEPFGWAAYHYGRWTWEPSYGWVWVPGYQWAPAWVSWRTSGDVIGWAPLAPGFSLYLTTYPFMDAWWTFMPCNQFVSYPVYRHAYHHRHVRDYYYRTAPAPARPAPRPGVVARGAPMPAWGGPAPRHIEERSGRRITPVRVVPAPSPGVRTRPGEVAVYRPGRPVRDAREVSRGAPVSRGRDRAAYVPDRVERGERSGARGAPRGEDPGRGAARAPADRGSDRGERGWAPSPAPGPRREVQDRGGYVPQPRREERSSNRSGTAAPERRSSGGERSAQPAPRAERGGSGGGRARDDGGGRGRGR